MAMKTKQYDDIIKECQVKPKYIHNMLISFFFGGAICLVGQLLTEMYVHWFGIVRDTSTTLSIVSLILLTTLFTGFGVYDRFGQIAKAGAFVPITGFANSLTSAALESKHEGIILGIASNLMRLAGAVIVFSIVSAYVFGIIRYVLSEFGFVPELEHISYLAQQIELYI
ncbi:MAG: stage V sporulation protein AC [Turicibacter sp.]|nr:stage V sporulation protein AC [Turicibacter sp.]